MPLPAPRLSSSAPFHVRRALLCCLQRAMLSANWTAPPVQYEPMLLALLMKTSAHLKKQLIFIGYQLYLMELSVNRTGCAACASRGKDSGILAWAIPARKWQRRYPQNRPAPDFPVPFKFGLPQHLLLRRYFDVEIHLCRQHHRWRHYHGG